MVKQSKEKWEAAKKAYQNYLNEINLSNFGKDKDETEAIEKKLEQLRIDILNAYYMYIKDLTQALAEKEE